MYLPMLLYAATLVCFGGEDASYVSSKPYILYFPDDEGNPIEAIIDPKLNKDLEQGLQLFDIGGEGFSYDLKDPHTSSLPDNLGNTLIGDTSENLLPDVLKLGYKHHPEKYISFFLYTRQGRNQLFVGDRESLHQSAFKASLPTRLVTHGYVQSENADSVKSIKNKYLEVEDCNVIIVDWHKLGKTVNYASAKSRTEVVGPYIAKLIEFLVEEAKLNLADVHLIGHSLGAHVMGLAGKNVKSGKVARITGLDPAKPLYSIKKETNRLTKGDADFVDVIHTCGGQLGFEDPVGDVDFYCNRGRAPQPGCPHDVFGLCSHRRSCEIFAESIGSDAFKSVPCESYYKYKAGKCDHMPKASMGQPCPRDIHGNYYLASKPQSPFAQG